jgi:hypothetical protein
MSALPRKRTFTLSLWPLGRQLVDQLGPLAFDHGPHFIRDMIDVFNIDHVLVEAFQVCGHHDLATDDARLIDTAFFGHPPAPIIVGYSLVFPILPFGPIPR